MKSITDQYYLKKRIIEISDDILLRNNFFEGLYLGLWNGVFFGIIWTITLNIFQIKNAKILISILALLCVLF